jgi:carbon storage regulator
MLVLTRRRGESIWIGNDIELVVVGLGPEGVKLGIRAPTEVAVLRGELFDTIAAQSRAAAATASPQDELITALRRHQQKPK